MNEIRTSFSISDLENFTGITALAVKQDFHATIFLTNYEALLVYDTNLELQEKVMSIRMVAQELYHILQEVEAMCNRVLFIDEGRLVYDGTFAQLASDGKSLEEHFHTLTTEIA